MKPTVLAPAINENRSSQRELLAVVNGCKAALDFRQQTKQRFTSSGSAAFESFRMQPWGDIPDDTAWAVSAQIVGRHAAGRCTFQMEALFYRASAAAVQQGATTIFAIRSSVLMVPQFVASGNGIVVQTTDDGNVMTWTLVLTVSEVK